MKFQTNNQSGFSLVELMVVVAIIGILATVAIPSVSKYMAKAKQAEAKTSLSAVYSANKAFFVEYGGYGTHFQIIGHAPEGVLKYSYGFNAALAAADYVGIGYTAAIPAAPNNAIDTSVACPNQAGGAVAGTFRCFSTKEARVGGDPAAAVMVPTVGAVVNAGSPTFTAQARSVLGVNGVVIDTWTMNQDKVLTNTVPGI